MEDSPLWLLADWFESLPETMGDVHTYRVMIMLPKELGAPRGAASEVKAFGQWLRDFNGGASLLGLGVMVAALVDFEFEQAANEERVPELLGEAGMQRARFTERQREIAYRRWRGLRTGNLSTESILRWNEKLTLASALLLANPPRQGD
jgi:hypothetical protein